MARVIHTGDTHLGYRQYHRPERRADFLDAFRQVAEDAVEDDVDAVVHAGDLFHDRQPSLEDVLGAVDVLRTLDDADVPFLAVVGNHEGKRDAQWLDLFASMGLAERLGEDPVLVEDTAFYGLDYVPESRREDLTLDFAAHDAAHAALVTHGLFEPFDFGTWDTEALLDDVPVDLDALLLGDNHHPDTAEVDGTWVTYCGSTERASADEREDRGYNLVTFDDSVTITRRGLDTRRFVFVDCALAEGEGEERVRERAAEHDVADAVVVVTVDGDGEPFPPASVEEFARDEGALVARVTDRREAPADDDLDVSFADPDAAVEDRVRELGLSEAARTIDETVRSSGVADSNVAATVEDRVATMIDETPSAFDGADDAHDAEVDGEDDTEVDGENDTEVDGEDDADVDGEDNADVDGGDDEANAGDGEADSEDDVAASGDRGESVDRTGQTDAERDAEHDTDPSDAGDRGQASVEEFL